MQGPESSPSKPLCFITAFFDSPKLVCKVCSLSIYSMFCMLIVCVCVNPGVAHCCCSACVRASCFSIAAMPMAFIFPHAKDAGAFKLFRQPHNGLWLSPESSQRWPPKKIKCVWKLVLLLFLGLCGMYACLSNVERQTLHDRVRRVSLVTKARVLCARMSNASISNFLHYPQPTTFDRKECRCTAVHKFVIFSMQRTGSGWFETLLNSHPSVSSHGEIFSLKKRRQSMSTIKKTLDTVYNLDWNSSASKDSCTRVVGLKWMLNQGVMEYKIEVARYLKDNSISVLFLFRQNLLRRYVSILANAFDQEKKQLNGTHQAHVHSKEEANLLATYKPRVNLTSFIMYLKRTEEIMMDAKLSFNGTRNMVVYYEDLVEHSEELEKVQEFLLVDLRKLESKHVKIHTLPLSDQIENWRELSVHMKRTKYKSLMY